MGYLTFLLRREIMLRKIILDYEILIFFWKEVVVKGGIYEDRVKVNNIFILIVSF